MDALTAFGVVAVGSMMVFYTLESRSRWWTLAFALGCWTSAVYGLLVGAWPFAVVESVWGVVALRKFKRRS